MMARLLSKFPELLKLFVVCTALLFAITVANAENLNPPPAPAVLENIAQNLSPQERMDMLARLSDTEVRNMLINYLKQTDAAGVAVGEDMMMMDMVDSRIDVIRGNLASLLYRFPDIPQAFALVQTKLTDGRDSNQILIIFGFMIVVMAVAYGVELFFRKIKFTKITLAAGRGGRVVASILDLVSLGIFTGVTLIGFLIFYQGHVPSRALFLTYFSAVLIVRFSMLACRLVLSPKYPHLRFFEVDDQTALYWNRAALSLSIVGAFGFLTCDLMARLGVDPQLHNLLTIIVGVVFVSLLVRAIWKGRQSVLEIILGHEAERENIATLRRVFAHSWHYIVIIYVVAIFGFAIISSLGGNPISVGSVLLSLSMVILLPLTDAFIAKILTRSTTENDDPIGENQEQLNQEQTNDETMSEQVVLRQKAESNSYARILIQATRLLLIAGAFLILAKLWGVDFFGMANNNLGGATMRALLDIGITCLLAYVVWELIKAAIDKHLAKEETDNEVGDGEGGEAGGSRLVTLLPLIRKFFLVTIIVMAAMIILSALGVDIGPMIAGAGVIGLAVGFGAQTLVKDIVSGIFFLVDDAFRVHEYVDVGSVKGNVERINVRSLTLRHHLGPVHTIPFGEIGHLTNYSRDWVIMKMMFRVTYDTDMKVVKKIFKNIGQDMLADETLGPGFLEPFKSQGVKAMEDSAMIIRAKFKAKPGAQFSIRKEAYQRVQSAFKEAGIEFAHRRVSVDIPDGIDPKSTQGEAIIEAAGAAISAQDEAAEKK